MKAYKCDRCGKLFEKYKDQGTTNFFNITRSPYSCARGNLLDLCPNCNAGLQEWVANDNKEQVVCNCTDAEIAKSFIEDVEAVKELLPQAESENNLKTDERCKECKIDWTKCGKCPVMMKRVKELRQSRKRGPQ